MKITNSKGHGKCSLVCTDLQAHVGMCKPEGHLGCCSSVVFLLFCWFFGYRVSHCFGGLHENEDSCPLSPKDRLISALPALDHKGTPACLAFACGLWEQTQVFMFAHQTS